MYLARIRNPISKKPASLTSLRAPLLRIEIVKIPSQLLNAAINGIEICKIF